MTIETIAPAKITEKRIVPVEIDSRSFAPFGKVIPMKDLRMVSSVPLRHILEGKVPIGKPTADTSALTFWSGLAEAELGTASLGVLTVKQRPLVCDALERHSGGPEILIPLDTCGMVMVVAPATSPDNPKAGPSADEARAFLLDGSQAIIFNPGTWHWVPYPMVPSATIAVIQKQDTYQQDTGFKRLVPSLKITIE